jgi:hypothetical protein
VLEVELVVLDPADGEGQLHLQLAQLRVGAVGGRAVDAVQLAEDLVALADIALVQLVVRLDRQPRDPVELEQRGLQRAGCDLLKCRHGTPSPLGWTAISIL